MNYPETELYNGIKARLKSDVAYTQLISKGLQLPATIGVYNSDYEDLPDKIPFHRDAVFVEYGSYELKDVGGYLKGAIPITLHIVQDIKVTARDTLPKGEQKHEQLLLYPEIVAQLLHNHQIDNTILAVASKQPDHNHKTLMVHKLSMSAKVKVKVRTLDSSLNIQDLAEMKATKIVSSAEILDAHNTAIELVPAPGAGKYLSITKVIARVKAGATAYDGDGNNEVGFLDGTFQQMFNDFAALSSATDDVVQRMHPATEMSLYEDKALLWQTASQVLSGDGTVEFDVFYDEIEL